MRTQLEKIRQAFLEHYPSQDADVAFNTLLGLLEEAGHKETVVARPFQCEGENPITGWSQPFKVYHFNDSYRDGFTHGFIDRKGVKELQEDDGFVIPIGMYEHSGVALYLDGKGSCPWDSSIFGVLYTNQEIWQECMGDTPLTRENIIKYCKASINDTFTAYINNDVYGLEIRTKDGEIIDSLHGMFYGAPDKDEIVSRMPDMDFDQDRYVVEVNEEPKYEF